MKTKNENELKNTWIILECWDGGANHDKTTEVGRVIAGSKEAAWEGWVEGGATGELPVLSYSWMEVVYDFSCYDHDYPEYTCYYKIHNAYEYDETDLKTEKAKDDVVYVTWDTYNGWHESPVIGEDEADIAMSELREHHTDGNWGIEEADEALMRLMQDEEMTLEEASDTLHLPIEMAKKCLACGEEKQNKAARKKEAEAEKLSEIAELIESSYPLFAADHKQILSEVAKKGSWYLDWQSETFTNDEKIYLTVTAYIRHAYTRYDYDQMVAMIEAGNDIEKYIGEIKRIKKKAYVMQEPLLKKWQIVMPDGLKEKLEQGD